MAERGPCGGADAAFGQERRARDPALLVLARLDLVHPCGPRRRARAILLRPANKARVAYCERAFPQSRTELSCRGTQAGGGRADAVLPPTCRSRVSVNNPEKSSQFALLTFACNTRTPNSPSSSEKQKVVALPRSGKYPLTLERAEEDIEVGRHTADDAVGGTRPLRQCHEEGQGSAPALWDQAGRQGGRSIACNGGRRALPATRTHEPAPLTPQPPPLHPPPPQLLPK